MPTTPTPDQYRQPATVAVEGRRKLTLLREKCTRRVVRVRVDGGRITDQQERCDYLFEIFSANLSTLCEWLIFVELKGSDIEKACNQLIATITRLRGDYPTVSRVEAYIVCSYVPRSGATVQRLQEAMRRKHPKVSLYVKSDQATVNICP